jgi:hypothetical protein
MRERIGPVCRKEAAAKRLSRDLAVLRAREFRRQQKA